MTLNMDTVPDAFSATYTSTRRWQPRLARTVWTM